MSRIAIMQPYFLPYAGYFRLMAGVDAFVIGDDRQFPARGWVHRNRLLSRTGQLAWLTLPMASHQRLLQIRNLRFGGNADQEFAAARRRFAAFDQPNDYTGPLVERMQTLDHPLGLIVDLLKAVAGDLNLSPQFFQLSELGLAGDLKGAEIIYATCEKLGAREYLNAPGGAGLYDPAEFRRRGTTLLLLPEYQGSYASIFQRLTDEPPGAIRKEIDANC